jgi:NTP pyrophosphatase (non-canonical NTP hydrolase)
MHDIIARIEAFDKPRGWDHYNRVRSDEERVEQLFKDTVNLVGEVGEFANLVKKAHRDHNYPKAEFEEELADALIFLVKTARTAGVDLERAVIEKLAVNERRWPV